MSPAHVVRVSIVAVLLFVIAFCGSALGSHLYRTHLCRQARDAYFDAGFHAALSFDAALLDTLKSLEVEYRKRCEP